MKKLVIYFAALSLYCGCAGAQSNDFAVLPQPKTGESVATFGGGCFWSMSEAISELKGVNKVISGYAGGSKVNPTYEEVSSQTTKQTKKKQIYYDPKLISFATLGGAF